MYDIPKYECPIEFNLDYKEEYDYWQGEYQADHFILSGYTENGYDLERVMEIGWYSATSIRNYNFNLVFNV